MSTDDIEWCDCALCVRIRELKAERSEMQEVLKDLYGQQECCRVDMNGSTTVRLRHVSASLWTRWMKAIEED